MESSVFQTVPLDSMWSLHRLHMDSTWSPWRLLGTSRKCGMESSWTLHGVSVESPWSPHGVHVDSLWTPQSLRGLHGNPWVSVKYSCYSLVSGIRPKTYHSLLVTQCGTTTPPPPSTHHPTPPIAQNSYSRCCTHNQAPAARFRVLGPNPTMLQFFFFSPSLCATSYTI